MEPFIMDAASRSDLPAGIAVDVGCGAGSVTQLLGERFAIALGLDHAYQAVAQATARAGGPNVRFGVADACVLPIRDASASLVVDRGCLHCLPLELAPRYLQEVARVLAPGGRFALVAGIGGPLPPLQMALHEPMRWAKRSALGARRARAGTMRRVLASPSTIRTLLPDTLEVEHTERVRPRSDAGWHLRHVHLVARRVEE